MFSPKFRQIDYRITKPDNTCIHIPVQLDERGLRITDTAGGEPAEVAEYAGEDCISCERYYGHCKAERAIADVTATFDDLQSTDLVNTAVEIEGRTLHLESPAPRALASLMGLLMASSGCPRLLPFRAMAVFHQPFATPEENVVRAAGFWLIRSWTQGIQLDGDAFASLQHAWSNLEEVNQHVSAKVLANTKNDAASNGIAYLDVLAKIGTFGLDSALDMLRPVLAAQTQPAAA